VVHGDTRVEIKLTETDQSSMSTCDKAGHAQPVVIDLKPYLQKDIFIRKKPIDDETSISQFHI